MTLLDTGIRASELCKLTIDECDLKNRRMFVFGKGAKQRMVPISAKTSKAIWTYLTSREEKGPKDPVFASRLFVDILLLVQPSRLRTKFSESTFV